MAIDTLKSVLRPAFSPLLNYWRRRPFRFTREMDAYFRAHCTNAPSDSQDKNLLSLIENGFVVLSGYHDRSRIQLIHDKAYALLEQVRQGTPPRDARVLDYGEDGIYRLRDVEHHIPEAAAILNDKYLRSVLSGYLQASPVLAKSDYIDYKPDLKHDYTSVLHMDSFKSQLKIFTLLSDVTERNAPLVYWSKTHRDGAWRRRFDYLYWLGDFVGTHGHVPITSLRELRESGGPEAPQEVKVTGPAGTVVIADTRGIHRASCLIDGYRLEMVQKFSL